jgi:hypothetical protein
MLIGLRKDEATFRARCSFGFNTGIYAAIDLSTWLATNPADVLSTNDPSRREILADHSQRRHGREDEPNFHRGAGELSVPSTQHIVGAAADNQESAGHPGSQHDMDEPFHGRRTKNHFPVVLEAEVWRDGVGQLRR